MPITTVDQLADDAGWNRIDLLHADIQRFEWQMLQGAARQLEAGNIGWIFISTHRWLEDARSMDLHESCKALLEKHNYKIVAHHTPEQSYSTDGLIVARSPHYPGPDEIELSHRPVAG